MPKRKPARPSTTKAAAAATFPGGATIYRLMTLNPEGQALFSLVTGVMPPKVLERDAPVAERIRNARTTDELLDVATDVHGTAEQPWFERIRALDPDAVPAIAEHLRSAHKLKTTHKRDIAQERLISALRWQGDAGAQALLDCYPALDDYGRDLAGTVFGLLRAENAAEAMWNHLQQMIRKPRPDHFVGTLWGLIDLHDPRVAGVLLDLLQRRRAFYEIHGFLALAGDATCVIPLISLLTVKNRADHDELLLALTAIAHRLGRNALLAAMRFDELSGEAATKAGQIADMLLDTPREHIEDFFELFFKGLTAASVLQQLVEGDEPLDV